MYCNRGFCEGLGRLGLPFLLQISSGWWRLHPGCGGWTQSHIYIYANTNSYMIIYIFGGNCLFGLPARSTTSPQKKSDSTFSRKMMLGSPESVEVVPYRSGLSFTPLGEPTNPKVGPTVLNGGGGVCRFEVHSHYFIIAIETYQPPKTNRKIRPQKFCYLFWQVDPFIILPPFFGTKKKNGLHLRGWTFGGGKTFGEISRRPAWAWPLLRWILALHDINHLLCHVQVYGNGETCRLQLAEVAAESVWFKIEN